MRDRCSVRRSGSCRSTAASILGGAAEAARRWLHSVPMVTNRTIGSCWPVAPYERDFLLELGPNPGRHGSAPAAVRRRDGAERCQVGAGRPARLPLVKGPADQRSVVAPLLMSSRMSSLARCSLLPAGLRRRVSRFSVLASAERKQRGPNPGQEKSPAGAGLYRLQQMGSWTMHFED
jgi:hypothetical protein